MLIDCSEVKKKKLKTTKKWFVADGMIWESSLYRGVENGTLE